MFDIFLSHSFRDARVILGIREWLTSQNLQVYVDWIDDPELDRSAVSAATAARLREQMGNSRSLIYATSRAAKTSRWMPWELGYFDGSKGSSRVSIMRLESSSSNRFVGEEYLGLYKQIEQVSSGGKLQPYAVRPSGKRGESLRSFSQAAGRYEDLVYR
ncbi:TIR domain-containing protein [Mycobacteroides abscessus]|nr:TIR domain-containing protein [Mycobacteroides abscessus]MDO3136732.1 TIR domain-containing protein [Mycobacteroides abscessus subsp. abscessus]MDO3152042.1 TIR domain-containing protein [Mycobacteroides abscessus subsp. abscessus]NOS21274.1 TIR domain-containing protein [Mycobacteroides abscessus]RIR64046.1 TIR domain-containing protein [Mycobacteroides abscessus]